MTITEFSKVYGVDKREVDYWTRLSLLHPFIMDNGYRDYEGRAEDEIKIILIARMLDIPGSLESKIKKLKTMDKNGWRNLLEKFPNTYDNVTRQYNAAFRFIFEKANGE